MTEASDRMAGTFMQRCRPRQFEEVCILAFDGDFKTDDLAWFSAGVDSRIRAGVRGFVLELTHFNRHQSLEEGLGELVRLLVLITRRGGVLNWLHGQRFINEWRRLNIFNIPPNNFETEREAVEATRVAAKAARLRDGLSHRLTTCGLSFIQIATMAGLFESDVRKIANGRQSPSDAVVILISSALDSLTPHPGNSPT